MAVTPGMIVLAPAPGYPGPATSVSPSQAAAAINPAKGYNNQVWVLGGTFRGIYWNRVAPAAPAVALASGDSCYDVARNAFLFTDGTGVWWHIGSAAQQGN
jgi:hypothetical protein